MFLIIREKRIITRSILGPQRKHRFTLFGWKIYL